MKRVICLSVFMVILMTMNMNCTKCTDTPDSVIPTEIKTLADLNGKWEIINLKLASVDYPTCESFYTPGNYFSKYSPLFFEFDFNSSDETCTVTDKCSGNVVMEKYTASITNNIIKLQIPNGSLATIPFYKISYVAPLLVLQYTFGINNIGGTITTELTLKKR